MPQPLAELLAGPQALRVHVRHEDELLQGGGALLLLPPRCHCGVQAGDLHSARGDAVQVAVHLHINGCERRYDREGEARHLAASAASKKTEIKYETATKSLL